MPSANGIQARIHLSISAPPTWTHAVLLDDHGQSLFTLARPEVRRDEISTIRLISPGGATLFRFTDHTYALTAETQNNEPTGSNQKP